MLALIEEGSLFLHCSLAGLLHWVLLSLAVVKARPCLVHCFVRCGQTCSRSIGTLFSILRKHNIALPLLNQHSWPFSAGRTSWKVVPPGMAVFNWMGGGKPVILDSQMALTRLQRCTCLSGWTLTFFLSEVWFVYNWQLFLQLPSWVISLFVLFWHLYLKSILTVINQPCFSSPNLNISRTVAEVYLTDPGSGSSGQVQVQRGEAELDLDLTWTTWAGGCTR